MYGSVLTLFPTSVGTDLFHISASSRFRCFGLLSLLSTVPDCICSRAFVILSLVRANALVGLSLYLRLTADNVVYEAIGVGIVEGSIVGVSILVFSGITVVIRAFLLSSTRSLTGNASGFTTIMYSQLLLALV